MANWTSHADIWDDAAANSYDTPGSGMFAPDVLAPAVDMLARLAGGGAALELAIGTGRVAIPLHERGVPVSGIDIAPPMLRKLHESVDAASLPTVAGDMTTTQMPGRFTLVFLVFNGISNVGTQAEQVACFRNAARHLVSGGRFVIELWVPELPPRLPAVQASIGQAQEGYMLIDTIDTVAQHVVSHHFRFGGDGQVTLFRSPHRYIWPAELDLMAQLAGFELESRHADWRGTPFTAAATSHVSVYRLRG